MKWIKVSDQLPPEGEQVLTYSMDEEFKIDYIRYSDEGFYWCCVLLNDDCQSKITHWTEITIPESEYK